MYHPPLRLSLPEPRYFDETKVTSHLLAEYESWLVEYLCELDYLRSIHMLTPNLEHQLTQYGEQAKNRYAHLSAIYYRNLIA